MKVLIADDQPRVRTAMRVLLDMAPQVRIIGEALNAKDLLAVTKAARPDGDLRGQSSEGEGDHTAHR